MLKIDAWCTGLPGARGRRDDVETRRVSANFAREAFMREIMMGVVMRQVFFHAIHSLFGCVRDLGAPTNLIRRRRRLRLCLAR